MRNVIGSPVEGDDFLFRDAKLKKALRYVQNGNSFLMLGIRRTGKSSFIRQVAYWLKKDGGDNVCLELDCSTCETALDFYKELYEAMPKSLQEIFKKTLRESKQIPRKIIDFFADFLESVTVGKVKIELRDQLLAYSRPFEKIISGFFGRTENVYLFLDELPFLFENIGEDEEAKQEIKMILTSLRSWRNAGLAMGITGSLNLQHQLEYIGISRKMLAGLNTIRLEPFSREESEQLISELLKSTPRDWWTDEITERLLDIIPDYVPYFLQYAFNEVIVAECKTVEAVEEVYHNEIMAGLFSDFIYQFDDRLKTFDKTQQKAVMMILDEVAKTEKATLEALQKKMKKEFDYELVIKLFDHEFITLSGDQEYRFTLNIIKNWWKQKRGI